MLKITINSGVGLFLHTLATLKRIMALVFLIMCIFILFSFNLILIYGVQPFSLFNFPLL